MDESRGLGDLFRCVNHKWVDLFGVDPDSVIDSFRAKRLDAKIREGLKEIVDDFVFTPRPA
jgi:hypothetical protein